MDDFWLWVLFIIFINTRSASNERGDYMVHFEIKNLSFYYETKPGKAILDDISLTIGKGEYITICGRSGSGKTTLLRHLKSVLTPYGKTEGEVLFQGELLGNIDFKTQSAKIGYVYQNPDNQIVTDKVWHELAFGLESLGWEQKKIRLRVAEMASYFGIQNWFHKDVSELSGGQKQLLNLASIMAMKPEVLILDEPVSQLDPIAASDFLNTVRKINQELRTTIIITEHRLDDIICASDKVVIMEKGKIIVDDRPEKTGEYLQRINDKMFAAMPAPVQIYYGVRKQGINQGNLPGGETPCPLTVREGAEWLDRVFEKSTLKKHKVEMGEQYAEEEIKDAIVELREIWFRYGKEEPDILKNFSLKIPKNTIFSIVGGNGTGKSTALKTICGLCKSYRGKIFIEGKKIEKYKNGELYRGIVSMLPQNPQSLFVHKTVREELEEMIDGNEGDREERIKNMAQLCEITELLNQHPYDLSGGEMQRTALAKILLRKPRILLLDEPTKGMDNFFKMKFAEIINKLKAEGMTIVMVSHDVEFCARYADLVSMFFDGAVITTNTPGQFFASNSFYTTAANRMSRHLFENTITNEEVIELCQFNLL